MDQPNWANQTLWTGDCLDIMRGMNGESVDLNCLDLPFNPNTNYTAAIGSKVAGVAVKGHVEPRRHHLAWGHPYQERLSRAL